MSTSRRNRRDQNLRLAGLCAKIGITVLARATSTSGRWVVLLGEHTRDGLPCFDVFAVRADFVVADVHHFGVATTKGTTYDQSRDVAKAAAQTFYEGLVEKLQAKPSPQLQEEPSGLTIIAPDGTKSDFTTN